MADFIGVSPDRYQKWRKHTYEVDGPMEATTLNSATAKACGDRKKKFTMIFMHSAVATNLENLNLLTALKYTDNAHASAKYEPHPVKRTEKKYKDFSQRSRYAALWQPEIRVVC